MESEPVVAGAGPRLVSNTCSLAAAPMLPAVQPLVHVVVDGVELPVGVSRPKVATPPSEHRVEHRDDALHVAYAGAPRIGQLVDSATDSLHRPGRRPTLCEVPARIPLDAPSLVHVPAEEVE